MKSALCFILVLVITGFSYAAVIRVPDDQPRIQDGIDAAQNGDTVLVADGTYKGSGNKNLDFRREKAITVKSENGAENCIIDCENNGRGFFNVTEASSVISGFTIKNGSGDAITCVDSSPTIKNNIIIKNSGSGIFCSESSPTIENNIIIENSRSGIYCEGSSCSPIIHNNEIKSNTTSGDGGGIKCRSSSSLTISNNIISWNFAGGGGGGIYCNRAMIQNNEIIKNSAKYGGGIYVQGASGYESSSTIMNNTVSENSAVSGGGIFCREFLSLTVINTILWEDYSDEIFVDTSSEIDITYSDIQGGWPGEGNIDVDPLFIDPDSGDFHLSDYSLCIGAGIMTPDVPDTDIEGNPRPNPPGSNPDIGAYENPLAEPLGSITILSPTDGDEFFVGEMVDVLAEVRDRSGSPLEGVEVTFEAVGGVVSPTVVVTDANGQAITQLTVAEGENIVAAIVTEYPDIFDTVTVIGVVPVGSINGNVMDTVGRPVKLAFVIAVNSDTTEKYKAFTNGNGDYEILELPPATYWIICIKKPYKAGLKKAEVVAGGSTTVDFMLIPKLE